MVVVWKSCGSVSVVKFWNKRVGLSCRSCVNVKRKNCVRSLKSCGAEIVDPLCGVHFERFAEKCGRRAMVVWTWCKSGVEVVRIVC